MGNLRWLGNSRVVKSAYLWFFVVPRAARFIGPFAGEHDVTIPWFNDGDGATFHVTISLPFSWQMFYAMSIVFMLAQASYAIWCPEVVKRYSNFGEYRAEYAGCSQLLRLADHVVARGDITEFRILYRKIVGRSDDELNDPAHGLSAKSAVTEETKTEIRARLLNALLKPKDPDAKYSDLLDCLLELERKANRRIFYVSGTFFVGGLLLFAIVLGQNLYFTIRLFS